MRLPIYQIDAFTDRPFAGNPAAVCLLDEPRDDRWMQDVAREMNLSETAFLHREADGFRLRWFTPAEADSELVRREMTGGHDRLIRLALAHVGALP